MTYFVDINLPTCLVDIKHCSFIFVKDISLTMPDNDIWLTAIEHNYTLLTRDKDFYYRSIQSTAAPKVVLFRIGNCVNDVLIDTFAKHIQEIEKLMKQHRLLALWPNEIQIII